MDMADGCEDGPISVSRKTKKRGWILQVYLIQMLEPVG